MTVIISVSPRCRSDLLSLTAARRTAGQPVMRPLWFEFPDAPSLSRADHQFTLGPALLVAPVLEEGAASRNVTLPAGAVWYDAATGVLSRAEMSERWVRLRATVGFRLVQETGTRVES